MKRFKLFIRCFIMVCCMGIVLSNSTFVSAATASLKLKAQALNVVVNQTVKVDVKKNTTGKTVSFKSSNTKVATVSSKGVVTGKKPGIVTITATAGGKKATCVVTVKDVTLKLGASKYNVKVGENVTVKVKTNTTGKTVSFKSSDTKIAKVNSNGIVSGLSEGTVKITATAGGKKAECTVVVKSNVILPTELEFEEFWALDQGETVNLKATVLPSNAADKTVKYSSSDPSIASVDSNGTVTGHKHGTVYITAQTLNGIKAVCEVEVSKYAYVEEVQKEPIVRDTTLYVAGKKINLHESISELTSTFGNPGRIDNNEFGGQTYVYNQDYNSLVFVYVSNNKVVGYFTCAKSFSCGGISEKSTDKELSAVSGYSIGPSDTGFRINEEEYTLAVWKDMYGDGFPFAIFLTDSTIDQGYGAEEILMNPSNELISAIEKESFDIVNGLRSRYGFQTVRNSDVMQKVSHAHCEDMIKRNYHAHTTPDGVTTWDRYRAAGIFYRWAGEIIVEAYPTGAISSMLSFMGSPVHRQILLYPSAGNAGVGAAYENEIGYLTIGFYQ